MRLETAANAFGFEASTDFQSLADLSAATRLDGMDIDGESAVVTDTGWIAPGTAYVTLVYDPNSKESIELPDSYPISVYFNVKNREIEIQRIEPDVRSFYE